MCLAIPGKIKEIAGEIALADFNGTEKRVNISLIKPKIGDYVIVHAGFAIEITDQKTAEEAYEFISRE